MKKAAVGIDVDGTMVDSCKESYLLVSEAWVEIRDEPYPFDADYFRSNIRPFITTAGDFFPFTEALRKGEELDDLEGIRKRYEQLDRNGYAAYKGRRKVLRRVMERWMGLLPPFEGVKEMFAELHDIPVLTYVVSSKDKDSIDCILKHNSIDNCVIGVLDAEYGRRRSQLTKLLSFGFDPENIVLYDDSAENLGIAQGMGMHAVAAPQGYDLPERIQVYRQALPQEFPGVVKELLSI
jgi:FMN phosphatase YigB (HAD superfamily)